MVRRVLIGMSLAAALVLPLTAQARSYRPRPDLKLRQLEKVPLGGNYNLYLVKDQEKAGTYACAKGGKSLLIGRTKGGKVQLGTAQLQGTRVYQSRQKLYRQGIRVSGYEEKSVVAYLPLKDGKSNLPRFYTVIGPKDGRGPLLIERRPSRLVGGKPVEYSILDL